MTAERTIGRATLERMVAALSPDWALEAATREARGHTAVYHLELATDDGRREAVLKATPDDEPHGIATESRLLGLLAARTDVPVPGVLGAVDDHASLPAPFFLMESHPGSAMAYERTRHLEDAVLRRLAEATGRYLAELHGLDVVDAYGVVGVEPSGGEDELHVRESLESWPAFLRASVEPELEGLEGARFADITDPAEDWVERRLDSIDGVGRPALGRIDHGVHNLLFDPADGTIEALIDWGFTLAVAPGYDLRTVEYVLSGAVLAPLEDATDRRGLVREALREGYRDVADYPAAELEAAGDLYELMAVVRAMNHLEAGIAKVPEGTEDVVADGLRSAARVLIDG